MLFLLLMNWDPVTPNTRRNENILRSQKGFFKGKRAQLLIAWNTGYDARTVDYGFRVVLGDQVRSGSVAIATMNVVKTK